jgi:hypothetical protein
MNNSGPPTNEQLERFHFMTRVLNEFWSQDIQEMLFYRMNSDNYIHFYVICNDVFYWGTADLEEVTEDNFEELQLAIAETVRAGGTACEGAYLFCARVRKLRPQGAVYRRMDSSVWPLFDAVGPERELTMDNPKAQPRP